MQYTGERIIPEIADCGPGTLIYETHVARYRFAAEYVGHATVLDIACGVGYGTRLLADAGAKVAIGGDVSTQAIRFAQQRYSTNNTRFIPMGAEALPLPSSSVDCVVSFETLEHVASGERFVKEASRVLSSKGVLVISTPNAKTYGRGKEVPDNPFHTHEFSHDEFEALLGKHFTEVKMFAQRSLRRRSKLAIGVDAIARTIRSWDRFGWRRSLLGRSVRTRLETAVDAYDRNPIVRPLMPGDEPLFYIAVARRD